MAIRPFIDTLRELRQGQVLDELGERLNEVVAGVRESGKAGTLTLTIKVKPASRGNIDTLFLEDQVKSVVPKMERGATVFFSTPENNLTGRIRASLKWIRCASCRMTVPLNRSSR